MVASRNPQSDSISDVSGSRRISFAKISEPLEVPDLLALQVDSKEMVNEIFDKALAAGGRAPREAQDHGFMYERAFEDPDGHIWEVFWFDAQAAPH